MENTQSEYNYQQSFANTVRYVIEELYPTVFDAIQQLDISLQSATFPFEEELLFSHLEWMHNSLDALFRKEKILLFPFILKQVEAKDSKHIPNFSWVTQSHQELTGQLLSFKLKMVRIAINNEKEKLQLEQVIAQVNFFESKYMELQLTVEEKLISKLEYSYLNIRRNA